MMDSKSGLLFLSLVTLSSSQLIIPKRPLGYVYVSGSFNAPVHLDIHMGPLCSDSRDAFPVAKQVAGHYGPETLKLTLHMFPLPYHHQSFLVAKGAEIIRKLGGSDSIAYQWFKYIYASLDKFSDSATANMTTNNVIALLSTFARPLGIDPDKFVENMNSYEIETLTIAAWKYSCTRAIANTPTFLLNDIMVVDAKPTWTLRDWTQVIDPLLEGSRKRPYKTCPTNTKKCEYLPGKVECCTEGESCIQKVGCRC